MTQPRILIACVGNIFLGDDGFGVEVARRLTARKLPEDVVLKDFGIRGLDLAYSLMDPYDLVILVDACQRGGTPGTVYLIEPGPIDAAIPGANSVRIEAHGMNPVNALRLAKSMGGHLNRTLIVGCEPADLGPEEGKLGLSEAALAGVDEAIVLIEGLVLTTEISMAKSLRGANAEAVTHTN